MVARSQRCVRVALRRYCDNSSQRTFAELSSARAVFALYHSATLVLVLVGDAQAGSFASEFAPLIPAALT